MWERKIEVAGNTRKPKVGMRWPNTKYKRSHIRQDLVYGKFKLEPVRRVVRRILIYMRRGGECGALNDKLEFITRVHNRNVHCVQICGVDELNPLDRAPLYSS